MAPRELGAGRPKRRCATPLNTLSSSSIHHR
jgi:hypothetical protein